MRSTSDTASTATLVPVPVATFAFARDARVRRPQSDNGNGVAAAALPTDPRWEEYWTRTGKMRVKTRPTLRRARPRTLLVRRSHEHVLCLAKLDLLAAVGVAARASNDQTLTSAVAVDLKMIQPHETLSWSRFCRQA